MLLTYPFTDRKEDTKTDLSTFSYSRKSSGDMGGRLCFPTLKDGVIEI